MVILAMATCLPEEKPPTPVLAPAETEG